MIEPTPPARRRAFSLLDLMIVVVIMGILASIVVPALNKHLDRSKNAAALTTHQMVRKGLDMYFQRHATWPATLTSELWKGEDALTMPVGYQLVYSPNSGELELATADPGAPAFTLVP